MDRRALLTAMGTAALGGAAAAAPRFRAEFIEGALRVRDGDRPVLHYRHHPVEGPPAAGPLFTRSGYVHPLHAPNGAVVTDDFPADHYHQRGVFFAWTRTRLKLSEAELIPDFWNLGSGTGRIRSTKVRGRVEDGEPLRFTAQHVWEARAGGGWEPVLDESWDVTLRSSGFRDPAEPGAAYLLDVVSRQKPRVALELPEYRYGGMAVRGARGWLETSSGMRVLTSGGKGRREADTSRARWVAMSGPVDRLEAGIALMEHPSNPRAPNPLRVHPTVPYFVFALPQAGRFELSRRKSWVFRYRVAAHNGPADPALLERFWSEFAGGRARP